MERREKILNYSGVCNLAIAAVGIVAMWLLSLKGQDTQAATAFVVSGVCAWLAIPSMIHWCKN